MVQRVLIVEDDPMIALDLEDLVSEAGPEVVVASSLAEARRQLDGPVDFALLDIDVIGGRTFEIAASLLARRTPFAFVSAAVRSEMPEWLRSVTFIPKPYLPTRIGDVVRRGLRPASA